MAFYFSFQTENNQPWQLGLASERENVIAEHKPFLTTVLDADNDFKAEHMTREEKFSVKYRGPLYFDFDGEDIEYVAGNFKLLLNKLKDMGVNLDCVRLYATGGRGFHIEVPMGVFMKRVPPQGVAALYLIYREMVSPEGDLYVETQDMRVYSNRRMWRTPNILRDNGKYKVQISAAEALSMTPEMYELVCSAPRPNVTVAEPAFNANLALMFNVAKDKVDGSVKKLKQKKARGPSESLAHFKGEWPKTVKAILSNEGVREDAGWNQIAMQLALTAIALGKTEEMLLADAEVLLRNYKGDSTRYGTYFKRKRQLRDQFSYMDDNPSYEYSAGAVARLMDPDFDTSDLSGASFADDSEGEIDDDGEAGNGDSEPPAAPTGGSFTAAVRLNKNGIFVRSDEGYRRASRIGLANPIKLLSMSGETHGYHVDIYKDGVKVASDIIGTNCFANRAALQSAFFKHSASLDAQDRHCSLLLDILDSRTTRSNDIMHLIDREGISLVLPENPKNNFDRDIVWVSPYEIMSHNTDRKFHFRGAMVPAGNFQCDVMRAGELTNCDAHFKIIDAMLRVNSRANIGKIVGWFAATPLAQAIRHVRNSGFPLLQVFGQAGSGKSRTVRAVNHMFYHHNNPRVFAADGVTRFVLDACVGQSASMPVVFDEYKARAMPVYKVDMLRGIFRGNYGGDEIARGSLSKGAGASEITTRSVFNSAPIAFISEAIEDEAAILARSVMVTMTPQSRAKDSRYWEHLDVNSSDLSPLGKALINDALSINLEALATALRSCTADVIEAIPEEQRATPNIDRTIEGLAVILFGLRFLDAVLAKVFGNAFSQVIGECRQAILDDIMDSIPSNMSECSRVLNTMSQMTRHSDTAFRLEKGVDYLMSDDGTTIDIRCRPAFAKYKRYCKAHDMEVMFASDSKFEAALRNYAGVVTMNCIDNRAMYRSPLDLLVRFNCEYLDKERIEPF